MIAFLVTRIVDDPAAQLLDPAAGFRAQCQASASFIDVPLSFCITVAVSMPLTAEWRNQINK